MAGNINTREIVYDMLMAVEKEQVPSHILLSQTLMKYQYLDKKDRAFISRLFRGTLEYEIYLDYVIRQFSAVKWNKIKPPVRTMLRMAAYQILKMDHIPDSAACDEAVKLAKKRGLKNLSGFVNGVLRNLSRNKDNIRYPDAEKEPAAFLAVRYALPEWLTALWLKDYDAETIARMGEAMLTEQKTTVRVRGNIKVSEKLSAEEASEMSLAQRMQMELQAAGIQAEMGAIMPEALRLSGYDYLGQIPAFAEGRMVVQDESAMLAAAAAGIAGGENIIDVCAAPGGKSMHMADLLIEKQVEKQGAGPDAADVNGGAGHVEARDLTAAKTAKIEENIERTGLSNISVRVQDALVFSPKDEMAADLVMADLPCSGLGVMGKKADIKLGMSEQKIEQLAALQREILSVVQRYVKPGGTLIYSTCTVSKAENTENMQWFEKNYPFKLESLDPHLPECVHSEETKQGWIQILPGQYGSDGFFIARFRRSEMEG